MIILRINFVLLLFTLFFGGIIAIFSSSSAEVLDMELSTNIYSSVLKQGVYGIVAILIGLFIYRIGYTTFLQVSPFLMLFFTVILILTLIPGIGKEVNGSRRWIALGSISFQPSELFKYVVLAFFIHEYMKPVMYSSPLFHFIKVVAKCLVPIGLILIEPNNGTVAVIGFSLLILCFLLNVSIRYWGLPLLICLVIATLFASQLPYVMGRVKVYLNPELDIRGKGHQPYQAKIAAGSGGLLGKGPGKSLQKLSYLPEAQNDYIAAIIAEEFGFIGMFTIISVYALIALLGFYIASNSADLQGCYLAAAIASLISIQAFLNMGVVSGLFPSTGLNLPFVSQGGTSLIANTIGVALILSVGSSAKSSKNFIQGNVVKK